MLNTNSEEKVIKRLSQVQMREEHTNKTWRFRDSKDVILPDTINRVREKDLVNGLKEVEKILLNYENVDEETYYTLINVILLTPDLARVVLKTSANKGFSFLLLALRNPSLKLNAVQKAFVVREAMYRKGTTFWKENNNTSVGEDDSTIYIDMDRYSVPIGACFEGDYSTYTISSVATSDAYGVYPYDIRYYILKNDSWSDEEKKTLAYVFFADDREYEDTLEQWELGVVNSVNNAFDSLNLINRDNMYECSLETLIEKSGDRSKALTMWRDIEFCRGMHEVRPKQAEKGKIFEKNKTTE